MSVAVDPWAAIEAAAKLPPDIMRVMGHHPQVGLRICYAFRDRMRQPLCGAFDFGQLKKGDTETPICQRCLRKLYEIRRQRASRAVRG